jgi:hypothetical protein
MCLPMSPEALIGKNRSRYNNIGLNLLGGEMRVKSRGDTLWILPVFVIVLSACTGGAITEVDPPTETPAEAQMESVDDTAPQAEDPAAVPTITDAASPRVPRGGLEATDPATVVLASGQPQIVEFFAFW